MKATVKVCYLGKPLAMDARIDLNSLAAVTTHANNTSIPKRGTAPDVVIIVKLAYASDSNTKLEFQIHHLQGV